MLKNRFKIKFFCEIYKKVGKEKENLFPEIVNCTCNY